MMTGLAKETVLVLHVVQTTLPSTESRSKPILTVYNLGVQPVTVGRSIHIYMYIRSNYM